MEVTFRKEKNDLADLIKGHYNALVLVTTKSRYLTLGPQRITPIIITESHIPRSIINPNPVSEKNIAARPMRKGILIVRDRYHKLVGSSPPWRHAASSTARGDFQLI